MGEKSPALNLELNRDFAPKAISELLAEVGAMDDVAKKLSKLNGYLRLLADEIRKIDAFKRELPVCMLLLQEAIERLKEEAMQCKERVIRTAMGSEEDGGEKLVSDCSDKKNWMSSAQLWNTTVQYENSDINKHDSRDKEERDYGIENLFRLSNFRNKGRAFVPFKGQSDGPMKEEKVVLPFDGLSVSIEVGTVDSNLKGSNGRSTGFDLSQKKPRKQEQKKLRRCWSPELHRRFVNALQRLGGAQAATPKQIRELMQVEGLTNDEVKSHLQKYRIHIRKVAASSAAFPSNGLQVAEEQFEYAQKGHMHHSGSPQGPLCLAGSAKRVSFTCGDSMEEEDDEKSESHSWKGRIH